MPAYELNLIIRRMPRANLVECLKRVGNNILDNESNVLRKIEYLASRTPPYTLTDPVKKKIQRTKFGSYFLFHFDCPISEYHRLKLDLKMDTEIMNMAFMRKDDPKIIQDYVCTLEEELLPPAKRKSVQDLIAEGRKERVQEIVGKGGPIS